MQHEKRMRAWPSSWTTPHFRSGEISSIAMQALNLSCKVSLEDPDLAPALFKVMCIEQALLSNKRWDNFTEIPFIL